MKPLNRPFLRILPPLCILLFLAASGCRSSETTERETVSVFSRLLPENALFTSEDGGVWGLDHRERRAEGTAERVVAQRYGPVFLPETEDFGKTLSLHITGIRQSTDTEPPGWYLDYTYEQADNNRKAVTLFLLIRLEGQWYLLPSGGYTPDQPGSMNLMKGRLYPDDTAQVIPGHYCLVLLRDWRGAVSMDAEEFELLETNDGFTIDKIQKPTDLFMGEVFVPDRGILREDGSSWCLVEAGASDLWNRVTDILEARAS